MHHRWTDEGDAHAAIHPGVFCSSLSSLSALQNPLHTLTEGESWKRAAMQCCRKLCIIDTQAPWNASTAHSHHHAGSRPFAHALCLPKVFPLISLQTCRHCKKSCSNGPVPGSSGSQGTKSSMQIEKQSLFHCWDARTDMQISGHTTVLGTRIAYQYCLTCLLS